MKTSLLLRHRIPKQRFLCQATSVVLKPSEVYQVRVDKQLVQADKVQHLALHILDNLHAACIAYEQQRHARVNASKQGKGWWHAVLFAADAEREAAAAATSGVPKSLYLWGSTGCGKTYLMNLFFDNLPVSSKRRIHFHDFMLDVHKRLQAIRNRNSQNTSQGAQSNPVVLIAEEIAAESMVLCFDEFQVTDIADAMILKVLFEALWERGLVLLATSNRPPGQLYQHGLQRELFLPFISSLESKAEVFSFMPEALPAAPDYRVAKYAQLDQHIFFSPLGASSQAALQSQLQRIMPSFKCLPAALSTVLQRTESLSLAVYGHLLHLPRVQLGRKLALFRFHELCDSNYGAADYLELATRFYVLAITDIPRLSIQHRNELRRFITLVDALYEHKVLVLFQAEVPAQELLQLNAGQRAVGAAYDESFAFDRTLSRLLEMQSQEYVAACMNAKDSQGQHRMFRPDALDFLLRELPKPLLRNDDASNELGWLLKQLWQMYRIGSVDEMQQGALQQQHPEHLLRVEETIGAEKRQLMRSSSLHVLLADLAELRLRDLQASSAKIAPVHAYLQQCISLDSAQAAVSYVNFTQFSQKVVQLLRLLE